MVSAEPREIRILHQEDVQGLIDQTVAGQSVRSGVATLVAGTATVLDDEITEDTLIRLTVRTLGGTPGPVFVSAKTADTSFVISSTSATDISEVFWEVVNPRASAPPPPPT